MVASSLWWSFAWFFACVAATSSSIFNDHRVQAAGPTWVPSPGATSTTVAYYDEFLYHMAADWCDIDYSAFAYDRAYEEDLCIDDFSHDFLQQALEPVSDARCVFFRPARPRDRRHSSVHQALLRISMLASLHRGERW